MLARQQTLNDRLLKAAKFRKTKKLFKRRFEVYTNYVFIHLYIAILYICFLNIRLIFKKYNL